MKITKTEQKIINYITKHKRIIYIIIISLCALLVRLSTFKFQSGDYIIFLNQ